MGESRAQINLMECVALADRMRATFNFKTPNVNRMRLPDRLAHLHSLLKHLRVDVEELHRRNTRFKKEEVEFLEKKGYESSGF
jgi:hypothetical protein